MNAYHGMEQLKMEYILTALQHEEADRYVKGLYWAEAEKRGCNIGCWTKAEAGDHEALSLEMGVPVELLHLSDGIFEALPDPDFKHWSRRFAGAIPVGADLRSVASKLLAWLLSDEQWGLTVLATDAATRTGLRLLAEHYQALGAGAPVEPSKELCIRMGQMRQSLSAWKNWDEAAMRDMRACRAALELWRYKESDPKSLSRCAWSARAAWSAWEAYTLAQAEAVLESLKRLEFQVR